MQTTLKDARQIFKTRFGMLDLAANYKNSSKYKNSDGLCKCTQEKEQESHILSGNCDIYGDIRRKHLVNSDESLMRFFREVMQRREALEEQERAGATTTSSLLAGGVAKRTMIELASTVVAASRPGDFAVQLVANL